VHTVLVFVRVKPGAIDAFCAATRENAEASLREPGVARFDVLQESDDPTRFTLVEVYRGPGDPALHKETPHYKRWRDAVEGMMAEPRRGVWHRNAFPDDPGFG